MWVRQEAEELHGIIEKKIMSITATIDDPNKMICSISVVHESPEMVIIAGDMNGNGKRAEVRSLESNCWQLDSDRDRGVFKARITLNDIPIEAFVEVHAEIGRYTLFIILVSTKSVAEAKEIYRETP